jgi:enamine deaminase RidA (YjgF/YER057c/UK114 family)
MATATMSFRCAYTYVRIRSTTTNPFRKALKAYIADDLPAASFIGVPALANSEFMVEIEATAVIDD